MGTTRHPAVGGTFYPSEGPLLAGMVARLLAEAAPVELDLAPAMLIVPHAGFIYSGPVAATAYRALGDFTVPSTFVLMGPSHFTAFAGVAASGADEFETPLGTVPLHQASLPGAVVNDSAHEREHSLEVQLPFLQTTLDNLVVLPLLTGDVAPSQAADVLEQALDLTQGFGLISSDLSHYLPYDRASAQDHKTAAAIVELRSGDLRWDDACGITAVQAALEVARRRGWECRLLDLRNSGDTAGGKDQVVGYGAFALGPPD